MQYPIVLDLEERIVLIVGAGPVAVRKARAVSKAGAHLLVVAPEVSDEMASLVESEEHARLFEREFQSGDLVNATLVFAATDDHEANEHVVTEARKRGVPANCAAGVEGDFIVPAAARSGDVGLSVWSGSPALSVRLRDQLVASLDEGWTVAGRVMAQLRSEVTERGEPAQRADFWRRLAEGAPDQFRSLDSAREFVNTVADEVGLDLGDVDLDGLF